MLRSIGKYSGESVESVVNYHELTEPRVQFATREGTCPLSRRRNARVQNWATYIVRCSVCDQSVQSRS